MRKLSIALALRAHALLHVLAFLLLLWAPAAVWGQTTDWTLLAPSNTPKWVGFSVMINNKMYVFSGFDNSSVHTTPKCEVYDPTTNSWTYLADMPFPVTHAGITVDGTKVYVAGGFLGGLAGDPNSDQLQIYDAATNTWSFGPKLPTRSGGNALVRVGRKLHSFGGLLDDRQTGSNAHYVLDLSNQAAGWTTAAGMPLPRCHFATANVAGKIYAMGGQTGHDGPIADVSYVHVFDPSSNTWSRLPDMPYIRSHSEPATFVQDGKVTLVGGRNGRTSAGADIVINKVTTFDPAIGSWTEQGPLPVNLFGPAAEAIGNELFVSNGGLDYATNPQTTTRKTSFPRTPNNKIGFLPGSISLSAAAGTTATKEVVLWALSGSPSYTIDTSTLPSWLSVSPSSGTIDLLGGNDLKITAAAGSLAAGTYSATITAKAAGYPDASLSVAFTVSGTKPKLLYLYGSIPPSIHDMKLSDTGDRGMSQFNQALVDVGFATAEALDASITLDAATLNNYKVLILSSNNRRFTAAEKTAVAAWVNAGGGLIAWSDAAFGWQNGGLNSSEGSSSDNDLTDQFGLHFLHDNGLGAFVLSQWAGNHYINRFIQNAGLTVEAEGASPIRTTAPATIIAYLPADKAQLNSLDGPLMPNDAALSVAKVGQGRVAGYFDRNCFWNNGDGTNINRLENRLFAQRLVLWASGVDDTPPTGTNQLPVANAGVDQAITLPTSTASLSGSGTDADGTISAYSWAQVSGPNTASFSSKSVANPTISGLVAGRYVFSLVVTDNKGASSPADQVTLTVNPAPGTAAMYRVNAGGGALTTSQGSFAADQYFAPTPGFTYSTTAAIAGTTDDALYQTERSSPSNQGTFSYALPIVNGTYTVVLHFADIYWTTTGKRLFDVSIENVKVLDNYDIIRKVGSFTATTETFTTSVSDGTLNIYFSALASDGGMDRPKVSAIEVFSFGTPPPHNAAPVVAAPIPDQTATAGAAYSYSFPAATFTDADNDALTYAAAQQGGATLPSWLSFNATTRTFSGTPPAAGSYPLQVTASDGKGGQATDAFLLTVNPAPTGGGGGVAYRLNAGSTAALSTSLGSFSADQGFSPSPGNTFSVTSPIAATTDDALYQTERYGTNGAFSYALPVASGSYTVVLHFAELYWTAAGQRVFDVSAEGQKVLTAYDIVKKVGALTATTETFS
ncbi:N-acetylneuraminic acid mutarotase, partial [Hymenobacter gelipurpurascens]